MSLKLRDISSDAAIRDLRSKGVVIRSGPFWLRIKSQFRRFAEDFLELYAEFPVSQDRSLVDFHVGIDHPSRLRAWVRPQIQFTFDGDAPFFPVDADQSAVMLEWGLNWAISNHAHQFLIIHAAVVARGDDAMVLSGASRSGKSTLTAALVHAGWRLLSDELALIDLATGLVWPLCRPINLKGRSIDIIARRFPDARFFGRAHNTNKGEVALMRAPQSSIEQVDRPARVRWLVEPRYTEDLPPVISQLTGAEAMAALANNSFNYDILGEAGFNCLGQRVATADRYRYCYSNLDDAIADFEALARDEVEIAA
jgi:HprK-related kinase A